MVAGNLHHVQLGCEAACTTGWQQSTQLGTFPFIVRTLPITSSVYPAFCFLPAAASRWDAVLY